jgi:uncharacterized spore protein YtfJ
MDTMMDERAQARTVATTTGTLERTLNQIIQAARAQAVFGEPVQRGDYTVIPCARVSVGLGLGGGSGAAPRAKGEQGQIQGQAQGQGEGAGGGGGANSRPMAVIVISQHGVRVQPIVDVTRVVVTSLVAAGMMAAAFTSLGARRRRAAALRAFAFGRMRPFGRGGAAVVLPFPAIKLPTTTQMRRALTR